MYRVWFHHIKQIAVVVKWNCDHLIKSQML